MASLRQIAGMRNEAERNERRGRAVLLPDQQRERDEPDHEQRGGQRQRSEIGALRPLEREQRWRRPSP